jgi:hypothetical protein
MIQSGSGGGFLREAVHAVAVGGNVVRENLESNLAMQFPVFSKVNFAHASSS